MIDSNGRTINYIRISVTDRCNYRCVYCMPKDGIRFTPHEEILTFEEIARVIKITTKYGISKVKITGGEPLVRKDIMTLIKTIKQIEGIDDVTMTTNGFYLLDLKDEIASSGLSTINVSIDTLDSHKYEKVCLGGNLKKVLEGIEILQSLGIEVRVNTTVGTDTSKEDIFSLLQYARAKKISVRFIEMMPVGFGAIHMQNYLRAYACIKEMYPDMTQSTKRGNGPARYYCIGDVDIGFIEAIHGKFCSSCNRIRLSATGSMSPCLAKSSHHDIKKMLRDGSSDEEIGAYIESIIFYKPASHHFEKEQMVQHMHTIGG